MNNVKMVSIGCEYYDTINRHLDDSRPWLLDELANKEHARQAIPYTDFSLEEIRLYACWDTEHWVIMLPGEY